MEVSAATGMLSAGTAGVLDSKACVVKGNCSALAADIAIGAVASRFPSLGAASRDAALTRGVSTGGRMVPIADFANNHSAFKHYSKHVKGIILKSKGKYELKQTNGQLWSRYA
jgi:hypothetical protein